MDTDPPDGGFDNYPEFELDTDQWHHIDPPVTDDVKEQMTSFFNCTLGSEEEQVDCYVQLLREGKWELGQVPPFFCYGYFKGWQRSVCRTYIALAAFALPAWKQSGSLKLKEFYHVHRRTVLCNLDANPPGDPLIVWACDCECPRQVYIAEHLEAVASSLTAEQARDLIQAKQGCIHERYRTTHFIFPTRHVTDTSAAFSSCSRCLCL